MKLDNKNMIHKTVIFIFIAFILFIYFLNIVFPLCSLE